MGADEKIIDRNPPHALVPGNFCARSVIFGAGMWLILRNSLFDLVDDGLEAQVDDFTKFLQSQPKDRPFGELQHENGQIYAVEHAGDYLQITRTVAC